MKREQYEALVRRLEESAARHRGWYKARVVLLTALGYGYLLFILCLVVSITAFLAIVMIAAMANGRVGGTIHLLKLEIPLLIVCGLMLKAMWVRFPNPEGIQLRAEDHPLLFEEIEKIRMQVAGPTLHCVMLDDEFNAHIRQKPMLGVFGFNRNYLVLGLPLMRALPPDQFLSVIAHEFGHLSGNHGKFSAWVYRVQIVWDQLAEKLRNSGGFFTFPFRVFFRWFAPYYDACTFVLRRENEYEADNCAAVATNRSAVAHALFSIELKARHLDEDFWPAIFKSVRQNPEPHPSIFTAMAESLSTMKVNDDVRQWFRDALLRETGYTDTHPALSDRLKALQVHVAIDNPDMVIRDWSCANAADYFLAENVLKYEYQFNRGWYEKVLPNWEEQHKLAAEGRERLAALEAKMTAGPLDTKEEWERASLVESLHGEDDAIPLYTAILEKVPDHAAASFCLGRIQLERNNAGGILHLERAMEKDVHCVPHACELIYGYFRRQGRMADARQYLEKYDQYGERMEVAMEERNSIKTNDVLVPHTLTPEEIDGLLTQLKNDIRVRAVYVARKQLKEFSDDPLYLIGIEPKIPWYSISDQVVAKMAQEFANSLKFPYGFFVLVLSGNTRNYRKKFKQVPYSLVYTR